MEIIATSIRRLIAVFGTVIAFVIFILLGGLLWALLLLRTTLSFSLAMFIAAMTKSGSINPAIYGTLNESVSFFPSGLRKITSIFVSLWHADPNSSEPTENQESDGVTLVVRIALVIFFFLAIYAILYWLGFDILGTFANSLTNVIQLSSPTVWTVTKIFFFAFSIPVIFVLGTFITQGDPDKSAGSKSDRDSTTEAAKELSLTKFQLLLIYSGALFLNALILLSWF